jgi:hypothetical protein
MICVTRRVACHEEAVGETAEAIADERATAVRRSRRGEE